MQLERELDALGREVMATLRANPGEFAAPASGVVPELPKRSLADLVLESEAGLLLGEPPARSVSLALPVFEPIESGTWAFGPSFAEAARERAPRDFLQILIVEAVAPATRALMAKLGSLRSLARRVPGWFAHSFGNETTVRIHRESIAAGLSQVHVATAHLNQLADEGFTRTHVVAVGLPTAKGLELIRPFSERLRASRAAFTGGSRSAALIEGCGGKDCRSCDERIVCDKVREVLAAAKAEPRTP